MAVENTLQPGSVATALTAWYRGRMPEATNVLVSEVSIPKSTGMSNETVLFTLRWSHDGEERSLDLAARVHPSGPGLFPDYDLERECRVMSALARHSSLPVPRVYAIEHDPRVLGRSFAVMERVEGQVLADDPPYPLEGWIADATPEVRAAVHDSALRALAELHCLEPSKLGLADLPPIADGDTAAARQLAYVERFAAFSAGTGEVDKTLSGALVWLREHCPTEDERQVLCWGDARLANGIFTDAGDMAAMLDWEEATLGPPGLDVSYWLYSMRYYSDGLGLPLLPGLPTPEETLRRYEELTGRPLVHAEFYEALGATRACCIVVRMMNLMVEAGMLPAESELPSNNPSTQLLAQIIGLPAPGGRPRDWAGVR